MDVHRLASASVVVGVDGSAGADLALDWAAGVAAQRGRTLHIVCGLGLARARRESTHYAAWLGSVQHGLRAKAAAIVEHSRCGALAAQPDLRVSTEVSEATPAEVLVRLSAAAYLVVLGAAGASGFAGHVGSVVLRVLAHGQGTIVVVRADPGASDRLPGAGPVVVGVDGSRAGDAAVGVAFGEAAERDTGLLAVYACHDLNSGLYAADPYVLYSVPEIEVSEQAVLAERLAGRHGEYPDVPVTRQVQMSDPVTALLDSAKSAQLLVVGSRGRNGLLGALLGSTSHSLVQHAQCPVMVVHPPEL